MKSRDEVKKALMNYILTDLQEGMIKMPVISLTEEDVRVIVQKASDLYLSRHGVIDRPEVDVTFEYTSPRVHVYWDDEPIMEVGH